VGALRRRRGAPSTWRSLLVLEAFPDSFNPLYFLIRGAAWLLALLVAAEAMLVLAGRRRPTGDGPEGAAPPQPR
jgi:hypothetical protein